MTVVIAPGVLDAVTTVRWETVGEIHVAGFDLYRARGDEEPVKLNENLLVAKERGGDGAVYGHEDKEPLAPGIYRYQVVAVDEAGFHQRYEEVAEIEVGS